MGIRGGDAVGEASPGNPPTGPVYLAIGLRNAGNGIAVIHGWRAREVIEARQPWTVELLYGDHEGGQRCITRFTMLAGSSQGQDVKPEDLGWFTSQSRHWNVDRPDPR